MKIDDLTSANIANYDGCKGDLMQHPFCQCVRSSGRSAHYCLEHNMHPEFVEAWSRFDIFVSIMIWTFASCISAFVHSSRTAKLNDITYQVPTQGWDSKIKPYPVAVVVLVIIFGMYLLFTGTVGEDGDLGGYGLMATFFLPPLVYMLLAFFWKDAIEDTENLKKPFNQGIPNQYYSTDEAKYYKETSHSHWVFTTHLLVASPFIAVILHLMTGWLDQSTLYNTIFILGALFALDGFSNEMCLLWSYDVQTRQGKIYNQQTDTNVSPNLPELVDRHNGILRLFVWETEAFFLVYLLTLDYGSTVHAKPFQHVFWVAFLSLLAGSMLLPDLIRQFTDLVSFSSIGMRRYGELLLRIATVSAVTTALYSVS